MAIQHNAAHVKKRANKMIIFKGGYSACEEQLMISKNVNIIYNILTKKYNVSFKNMCSNFYGVPLKKMAPP